MMIGTQSDMELSELAGRIESTKLSPTATEAEVAALAGEAVELGVFGVCIAPCRVSKARRLLQGTGLKVVSVAGFPLGFETCEAKAAEVAHLFEIGCDEVDAVINQGRVADADWFRVEAELTALRRAAGPGVLKIIFETGNLTPGDLARAASIAVECGVDYLKTSTGFGPRGASVEDVHFLAKVAQGRAGVKAAGGIRTLYDAVAMARAGADRIGTSAAAAILKT